MIQDSVQATFISTISFAFFVTGLSSKGNHFVPWFFNSAVFNHMSGQKHALYDLKPYPLNKSVTTANGRKLPIKGISTIFLTHGSNKSASLPNTLYVPCLIANLASIGQLTDQNYSVKFSSLGCNV